MLSMKTRNFIAMNANRYEAKGVADGSIRVFIFHSLFLYKDIYLFLIKNWNENESDSGGFWMIFIKLV